MPPFQPLELASIAVPPSSPLRGAPEILSPKRFARGGIGSLAEAVALLAKTRKGSSGIEHWTAKSAEDEFANGDVLQKPAVIVVTTPSPCSSPIEGREEEEPSRFEPAAAIMETEKSSSIKDAMGDAHQTPAPCKQARASQDLTTQLRERTREVGRLSDELSRTRNLLHLLQHEVRSASALSPFVQPAHPRTIRRTKGFL